MCAVTQSLSKGVGGSAQILRQAQYDRAQEVSLGLSKTVGGNI